MRKKEWKIMSHWTLNTKRVRIFISVGSIFCDCCLAFVAVVVGYYSFNHYIFGIFAFGQMVSYNISFFFFSFSHQFFPHVCTISLPVPLFPALLLCSYNVNGSRVFASSDFSHHGRTCSGGEMCYELSILQSFQHTKEQEQNWLSCVHVFDKTKY